MRYASIEEGRAATGLRLVLTVGAPGPWGEAAKAICKVKGLAFLPVAQEAGGENPALRAWTGQAGAPVAVFGDEAPRTDSLEILFLAERLAPTPRLIPEDPAERAAMFGLSREIIGRGGIGWERRNMLIAPMAAGPDAPPHIRRIAERYDCTPDVVAAAPGRIIAILGYLARVLREQQARGRRWFVGDSLSAADIYWACFSNMLLPLREEDCPMPPYLRAAYGHAGGGVPEAIDPVLIAHRDAVFAQYIGLPLDFLPE